MLTASSRQRLVALGCYGLSAFLIFGFLSAVGDGGLGSIVGLFYLPTTAVALYGAIAWPLTYCTVLKAVGLAVLGALIPVLLVVGPFLFTKIVHVA